MKLFSSFFVVLLVLGIGLPVTLSGQVRFDVTDTVKNTELSDDEAEIRFISERNDLEIQSNTPGLDIIDKQPSNRFEDDRYMYVVHARLRSEYGEWHRKRTFEIKIKGFAYGKYVGVIESGMRYDIEITNIPDYRLLWYEYEKSRLVPSKVPPEVQTAVSNNLYPLAMIHFHSQVELAFDETDNGIVGIVCDMNDPLANIYNYRVYLLPDSLDMNGTIYFTDKTGVGIQDVKTGIKKQESLFFSVEKKGNTSNSDETIPLTLKRRYVKISRNPEQALVLLNGSLPIEDREGIATFELREPGFYTYKVVCANYNSISDTLKITNMDDEIPVVSVTLQPSFGTLKVEGLANDTDQAVVYLDEARKCVISYNQPYTDGFVSSGLHNIKVVNPLYMLYDTTINMVQGQVVELHPVWKANYMHLSLSCPDKDASIWLNERKMGGNYWSGNLPLGCYRVETRKDGCQTMAKDLFFDMPDATLSLPLPSPIPFVGYIYMKGNNRKAKVDVYRGDSLCFTCKLPALLPLEVDAYSFVAKKSMNYNAQKQDNVTIRKSDTIQLDFKQVKVRSFFIEALGSLDRSVYYGGGCAIGFLHRHVGWKVSCVSDFIFDYDGDAVISGKDVNPTETAFLMAAFDLVIHLSHGCYLSVGGGYGLKKQFADVDGVRTELTDLSCEGVALKGGLFFTLGSHMICSLSAYSIGFHNADFPGLQLGLGFRF